MSSFAVQTSDWGVGTSISSLAFIAWVEAGEVISGAVAAFPIVLTLLLAVAVFEALRTLGIREGWEEGLDMAASVKEG
jgi:hypothetical protein